MAPRGALQALAERSGSDSDECMFDQTNLLQRRRMDITRFRRSSSTMSGQRLTVARTVNLCLSFFALVRNSPPASLCKHTVIRFYLVWLTNPSSHIECEMNLPIDLYVTNCSYLNLLRARVSRTR